MYGPFYGQTVDCLNCLRMDGLKSAHRNVHGAYTFNHGRLLLVDRWRRVSVLRRG